MLDMIGHTPIVKLKTLSEATGCEIYAKMENQNPGRSVKDRTALHIIQDAVDKGLLKKGWNLYESTVGSTGISLGFVSNVFGINTKIYLRDDLGTEKVKETKNQTKKDSGYLLRPLNLLKNHQKL